MNNVVLDSSALVALIKCERGYEVVARYLREAQGNVYIHDVNACETAYHLLRLGVTEADAWELVEEGDIVSIASITVEMKRRVAALKTVYRHFSLGDCFALAFAEAMDAEVLAADKGFAEIPTSVKVTLIR